MYKRQDGNGNNQIRIFLNGEEVTALSSPLSRRAYENGIPLYTGVRCWVGQVLFKNLSAGKISSFAADESSVDLLQEPKTVSSQEDLASSSEKEASDSQKIDNENSASDFLSSDESSEKSSVESSKNGEIDKETQQQSQSTTKEEALKLSLIHIFPCAHKLFLIFLLKTHSMIERTASKCP